jgi:hypothetical protein
VQQLIICREGATAITGIIDESKAFVHLPHCPADFFLFENRPYIRYEVEPALPWCDQLVATKFVADDRSIIVCDRPINSTLNGGCYLFFIPFL